MFADERLLAAAAAKINATLQARKGIHHVDVPPILSAQVAEPTASKSNSDTINGDMYIADGDYIKDIEVNDLRNRYTLTKSSTQKMVGLSVQNMHTDCPERFASSIE